MKNDNDLKNIMHKQQQKSMDDEQLCRNCGEDAERILVKDLKLAHSPWRAGNPYQSWCGGCGSFAHGVRKAEYRNADEKYILFPNEEEPEELENQFDCPSCGKHLYQFPDECRKCGVEYDW